MPGEDFRQQLDQVHRMGLNPMRPLTIDLSIVKEDREFNLAGNFFYIKDAPGSTEYIKVKVNSSGGPAINWTKQTGFVLPFNRLYITTPSGQTGTMTILIASESPELFDILDHRSAISASIDGILTELQGITAAGTDGTEKTVGVAAGSVLAANSSRKAFNLQAKSTNTGKIYLGFTNGVTTIKWFAELQAGQSCMMDDYRGPVFAIADAADQKLGWGEW